MKKSAVMWVMVVTICVCCLGPSVFAQSLLDSDNDGLTDQEEQNVYFTDPHNADTDGDGYPDGLELQYDYSPHAGESTTLSQHDLDQDGLSDWIERWFGSSWNNADTDGDGISDFVEVAKGYHPAKPDGEVQVFDRNILVNLSTQRLAYVVDRKVKLFDFPVSTGNPGAETPNGIYEVGRMIAMKDYRGADYFVPDVAWNMEFLPMYYIHSAYWHNDFGVRTHSHGCVNLREPDAKALYEIMDPGVSVEIIGTTPSRYVVGT
jgi:hypothetical protein